MMNKRHDEFSAELSRLKKLIPGLDCTEIYGVRTMPLTFVCYVENKADERFYMYREDAPQVVAGRLLVSSKELLDRIQRNVNALKEIVDAQQ